MIQKVEKIWCNKELINWDEAKIHVLSHTLHYGWGVFEGIRCYKCHNGSSAVFRLKEHIRRLFASAHIANMRIPFTEEEIIKGVVDTLKINKLEEGYIRPLAFIGDGEMGIYVEDVNTKVIIAAWPWGAYLGEDGIKNGIRAKISSFIRPHVNTSMTKAKICGNYVNSILAKREAKDSNFDEAILLDTEGYISEATGENVFMVKDEILKTPPLTSVLPGITRGTVIRIAGDLKIQVVEERFTRDELYIADEAFFTGTAAEITPIRDVDGRVIGEGRPGKITKEIQNVFFRIIRGKEDSYRNWLFYI
ncbi:MAG: branched-chain amino acid transaminase [Thermodesulfobacteriota bacterium]|nr:branched-chain amino acid transaminase [Thermodesulfobacteriota bacterium]